MVHITWHWYCRTWHFIVRHTQPRLIYEFNFFQVRLHHSWYSKQNDLHTQAVSLLCISCGRITVAWAGRCAATGEQQRRSAFRAPLCQHHVIWRLLYHVAEQKWQHQLHCPPPSPEFGLEMARINFASECIERVFEWAATVGRHAPTQTVEYCTIERCVQESAYGWDTWKIQWCY